MRTKSIRELQNQASRTLRRLTDGRRTRICYITRMYTKRMSIYVGIDMAENEAEIIYSKNELERLFNQPVPVSAYVKQV